MKNNIVEGERGDILFESLPENQLHGGDYKKSGGGSGGGGGLEPVVLA